MRARIKMKVRKKIRHVRHVTKGRPVRQVKKEKHVRGKGAKARRHVKARRQVRYEGKRAM